MNFLSHLEKNKQFWSILVLCVFFFILRLPSLIEPHWYGDEGIYQVIGQALHQGNLLYKDIWDNKPPLLYALYAIANGDQPTIRLLSMIFGIASVPLFFFLTKKLFESTRISTLSTLLYVILFGSPFLEGNIANAENFMLLLILSSALIIYSSTQTVKQTKLQRQTQIFISGIILGIAFLFKIVAIFDTAAFALFLAFGTLSTLSKRSLRNAFLHILPLVLGVIIPFVISVIYFSLNGILAEYLMSAFTQNIDYVGKENYLFEIPQGLLIVKILLLISAIIFIFLKRHFFSKATLFIILWTTLALFSANFSGRPYTHYMLVLLPSFCLLLGYMYYVKRKQAKKLTFVALATMSIYFSLTFPLYGIGKTFEYYQNAIAFLTNQKDLRSYQAFFDYKTPRDYAIASFIKANTTDKDKIFIWGDSPQIYAIANKLPPYKYAVAYHVIQSPELLNQTQQAIDKTKPKYIIVLPETQPLLFSAPLYIIRFNIEGAIIYERSI